MASEAARIAEELTEPERDLLMGRCDGWGSWMFTAGKHMVGLGLGYESNGSISLDSPLAEQVRTYLRSTGK